MKNKSFLTAKLENFYREIYDKTEHIKEEGTCKMRLKTDQKFNQREIKKFNKKFNMNYLNSRLNPNKAGFLRVVFPGGKGDQFDSPSYIKKNLSNINITLYSC